MSPEKRKIFLPKELVEKCSRCEKYLSVGPIKISKNKPICGRCSETQQKPALFYENLAQYMCFPCVNDVYGCDATLAWESVAEHEKSCPYSPINCPALNCEKIINPNQIIHHFQLEHKNLLIANNQFKVPCKAVDVNQYVNMLTLWEEKPFIVKINFSTGVCYCSILSWHSVADKNLKYDLLLENPKKTQSMRIRDVPVSQYRIKHHDNSTMTQLDTNIAKRVLNSEKVICTFSIGTKNTENKNPINEQLLPELQCPVCTKYMNPPIFMCSSGHSLCSSCKFNIFRCPTCQVVLQDIRNSALEKVTVHINFPCKFRNCGCSFVDKLNEVALHELLCPIGAAIETECYLNYGSPQLSCKWRGNHTKVLSHISLMHQEFFFDINHLLYLDIQTTSSMNVFMAKQGQVFKMCISYQKTSQIKLCIKVIKGATKIKRKYQFYIDFIDLNGTNKILNLNGDCVTCKAADETFSNCLKVPYHMLKPFVKTNELAFKINILEF